MPASHLHARFSQSHALRQFFARVNVRIMRALKGALQFLQLIPGEGRPRSTLLLLQAAAAKQAANCTGSGDALFVSQICR